ncbi:hypothetical protein OG738_07135 [Amycolatopsis sp. NBC_01488]|uniref:hypothetical protein n=1 Tax=Amycolatopsis sp. NBC_01488 TaxID=2903563 RepID=UPI002E2AF3C9|nr:hypothetical protein [Amycolatopsis sp. NBC_01488]
MNLDRFADGHLTSVAADGSRVVLRLKAYAEYRRVTAGLPQCWTNVTSAPVASPPHV